MSWSHTSADDEVLVFMQSMASAHVRWQCTCELELKEQPPVAHASVVLHLPCPPEFGIARLRRACIETSQTALV